MARIKSGHDVMIVSSKPRIRTGSDLIPWMKFEYTRFASPTTSITG